MPEHSHASALATLITEGIVAAAPPPIPLLAGNLARVEPRSRYKVFFADKTVAIITLGADLEKLASTHQAFAKACPQLVPSLLFFRQIGAVDILAVTWVDGPTLSEKLTAPTTDTIQIDHLGGQLKDCFDQTRYLSDEKARESEWTIWSTHLLCTRAWTAREAEILTEIILPAIRLHLFADAPYLQWIHGDLNGGNIILRTEIDVALIDLEFSTQTHFPTVEWVRFAILNNFSESELPSILPPSASSRAWQLFHWLTQIQREAVSNDAGYLATSLPQRLATIRRLAEELLGTQIDRCPWGSNQSRPKTAAESLVDFTLEDIRWLHADPSHAIKISGWCRAKSHALTSVSAEINGRKIAQAIFSRREDVQRHFSGDTRALLSGFILLLPPLVGKNDIVTLVAHGQSHPSIPFHYFTAGDLPSYGPILANYAAWAEIFTQAQPPFPPAVSNIKFSFVVPVYNTPPDFLRECIRSAIAQNYAHWELLLVDDASPAAHIALLLASIAESDSRIKLFTRQTNGGISRASNDALAAAAGEFVVMLDHDDLLESHALSALTNLIVHNPSVDVIYSDEDKITAGGIAVLPALKPDFSPHLLLGVMYPGHLLCVRASLARTVNGFDPHFDGIQDYDFFLRLTEHTRNIVHLPQILYHWRQSPSSSALHGNIKGNMDEKQAEAVRAHLTRRHMPHTVRALGGHRIRIEQSPKRSPSCALVIDLYAETPLPPAFWHQLADEDFDELVVLKGTSLPSSFSQKKLRIVERETPSIGMSPLQHALHVTNSDIIAVLTEIPLFAPRGWLAEITGLTALPDSALVSPLLLSAEGKVLESGWVLGQRSITPCMRGFDASGDGYNGALICTREVSIVSSRCYAISRLALAGVVFPDTSGNPRLDHMLLAIALGTGLRFNRVIPNKPIGMNVTWKSCDDTDEVAASLLALPVAWQDRFNQPDPFYNLHFDAKTADYRLAIPAPYQSGIK